MNSGPRLTQAGRCVLLAKCFWKTQQSPKAAPFHPLSLKEGLWLSTYEYDFILLKDVKIKRHDALNKGYVNRNTFITKNQKKNKKQIHIVLSYNMAADKKKIIVHSLRELLTEHILVAT